MLLVPYSKLGLQPHKIFKNKLKKGKQIEKKKNHIY